MRRFGLRVLEWALALLVALVGVGLIVWGQRRLAEALWIPEGVIDFLLWVVGPILVAILGYAVARMTRSDPESAPPEEPVR